jgi:hypothetical protein
MRYRAIQEPDRRDPIRLMCRIVAVLAAGYSVWRTRQEYPVRVLPQAALSHPGAASATP